ncbi:MAG TPA: GTPase domain-containing protein [Pirellulales bacterium]|nr:GTPase domain-containing protein [Pirellulales bacterium]
MPPALPTVPPAELAHLEMLAEVQALVEEVRAWATDAPDWSPARQCRALIKLWAERVDTLRVRLEAPLVVATLGGTGTGKSSLVNALVGGVVTPAGRARPTTREPVLICRPEVTPQLLGLDPASVQLVQRDIPLLRDLVILDCPDPDTTEDAQARDTNLARLRHLLPHCDVLLVTTTQQKYRSACVAEELAGAAVGARLVFVQTHADVEDDIRPDWRRLLENDYRAGELLFVDSLSALRDMEAGVGPRGDFGRLVDLLTRELAGAAAGRIRRANFLDLADAALAACRQRIDQALPAVALLDAAIQEQRTQLAAQLARQIREELAHSRRSWENRLLGEVAGRWGFSPFACLLRAYQGLGGILSGAALLRVRTPAQLALWGMIEGGRKWHQRSRQRVATESPARAVRFSWEAAELRTAAIIVDGYANDAALGRVETQLDALGREAGSLGNQLIEQIGGQLQRLIARLADRHSGWLVRWCYELPLMLMLALLAYRFGRNFFYDSWLAPQLGLAPHAEPLLGVDFFLGAGLCLLLWCGLLLWFFSARLRRGLAGGLVVLEQQWANPTVTAELFSALDTRCRQIHAWRDRLEQLEARVESLRRRVTGPEGLGHRMAPPEPSARMD